MVAAVNNTAWGRISSGYVAFARKVGFQRAYNLPLYIFTVGALLGFCLARLEYLNHSYFLTKALPGESYWYSFGRHRIGIILHLIGVLFGGILAALQFTPYIRHRFLIVHRITGYFAITFLLLGNAGAFMIIDHSVGGGPAMQLYVGVLGTAVTIALVLAYVNIKRLQIDQHRAWMIRSWAWAANILTLRIILLAGLGVVTRYNITLFTPIACHDIFAGYRDRAGVPDRFNPAGRIYPACAADTANDPTLVLVSSAGSGPEAGAAALRPLFVMAAWLAFIIHIFLVELYLWLTPAENHRLRVVSRERQVERGWVVEGATQSAGLGSDRLGDAPAWWATNPVAPASDKDEVLGDASSSTRVSTSL